MKFNSHIQIAGRKIGSNCPCYVIAEGGVNHFGDLEKGFALVDAAVAAGADAFKTQFFKTDILVSSAAPEWRERLRSKELSEDDLLRIRDYCNQKKITFLCTPHDEYALDFLCKEGIEALKIGSGEVENWPFIQQIASQQKPVILSVGMYTEQQVKKAISIFRECHNFDLAILHCHTGYPSEPREINLHFIKKLKSFFEGPIGYSDHTVGAAIPLASLALGADIIEKHITIEKNIPNAHDWIVSCDPEELKQFIKEIRMIEESLGTGEKIVTEHEKRSLLWARKSMVAKQFIPKSTILTEEMVTFKRPGTGISPAQMPEVTGRKTIKDIESDSLILEEYLA